MHLTDDIYAAVIDFYRSYPDVSLDQLLDLFAEECEWRSATRYDYWEALSKGDSFGADAALKSDPWGSSFQGKDGIRAYFELLTAHAQTEHYTMISHLRGADELAVRVHCSIDFGKTGAFQDYWTIDWWRFENGKAVVFEEYFDTYGTIRNYAVSRAKAARAQTAAQMSG